MSVCPLRTVQAACHDATVALLRHLLERAEAGEVIGFAGEVECADHYETHCTVNGKAQAVGMLEMAKRWILEDGQ